MCEDGLGHLLVKHFPGDLKHNSALLGGFALQRAEQNFMRLVLKLEGCGALLVGETDPVVDFLLLALRRHRDQNFANLVGCDVVNYRTMPETDDLLVAVRGGKKSVEVTRVNKWASRRIAQLLDLTSRPSSIFARINSHDARQ